MEYRPVEYIPDNIPDGVIYVSERFGTAIHKCPCGCGNQVVTPIGNDGWTFSVADGAVTLSPSIGNYQLPCESHYWITDGMVRGA